MVSEQILVRLIMPRSYTCRFLSRFQFLSSPMINERNYSWGIIFQWRKEVSGSRIRLLSGIAFGRRQVTPFNSRDASPSSERRDHKFKCDVSQTRNPSKHKNKKLYLKWQKYCKISHDRTDAADGVKQESFLFPSLHTRDFYEWTSSNVTYTRMSFSWMKRVNQVHIERFILSTEICKNDSASEELVPNLSRDLIERRPLSERLNSLHLPNSRIITQIQWSPKPRHTQITQN